MPESMTDTRRGEIHAALDAIPAGPWNWHDGVTLETADGRTLLAPAYACYLRFHAHDEATGGDDLLTAAQLDHLGDPNPVGDWIQNSAAYARDLLDENQRLAAELASVRAELAETTRDRATGWAR